MAHVHDAQRLVALQTTGLLDAPHDEAFDGLVRLVRRVAAVPTALITLVDADRQFFLAEIGFPEPGHSARQTPLSHSFCKYVVANEVVFEVSDARRDPLVADNGAVEDFGVTAYLGVPVYAPGGEVLGALCAIDTRSRDWTDDDRSALADLAAVASRTIADRVARREMGEMRAESEDREALLALAVEAAGYGLWSTDLTTGTTFWDPRCQEVLGVGPEAPASAMLGRSLVHPDDQAAAMEAFEAVLANPGDGYRVVTKLDRPDGSSRWVLVVGHVLYDGAGDPARILGLVVDVTARKQSEGRHRKERESLEREVATRTEALQHQTERARHLARALALAEQRERRRIAHVLHEDLQQILFGLSLYLGSDRMEGLEQHPAIQQLADRAIRLTRSLSHELAVPGPFDGRLGPTVEWLAESMRESQGLYVDVEMSGEVLVSSDIHSVAVQLVRELLANVVKHAGVDRATVWMTRDEAEAVLEVADEGVGFDLSAVAQWGRDGLGLRGIRDRIELVGGSFEVTSAPGEGTSVTLRFPADVRLLPAPEAG